MPSEVKCLGVRTNRWTSGEVNVVCTLEVEKPTTGSLAGETWIHMTAGGITGYESFQVTEKSIKRITEKGWLACAGSHNYDSLHLSTDDMRQALIGLGLITNNEPIMAVIKESKDAD